MSVLGLTRLRKRKKVADLEEKTVKPELESNVVYKTPTEQKFEEIWRKRVWAVEVFKRGLNFYL